MALSTPKKNAESASNKRSSDQVEEASASNISDASVEVEVEVQVSKSP